MQPHLSSPSYIVKLVGAGIAPGFGDPIVSMLSSETRGSDIGINEGEGVGGDEEGEGMVAFSAFDKSIFRCLVLVEFVIEH